MNSWEEDAFFEEWGYEKDLVKRQWVSQDGRFIVPFDEWIELSIKGKEFEEALIERVKAFGVRKYGF